MILAIDPGTKHSAYLFMMDDGSIGEFNQECPNESLVVLIGSREFHGLVIEEVRCFGMPVGRDVLETVKWTGKFALLAEQRGIPIKWVGRKEVVAHICGSAKAKDPNVRQAMIDKYGKETKGIYKDAWSALAIANFFWENRKSFNAEAT